MQSNAKQNPLRLAFGVHNQPKDAPSKVLRQIESDAQAIAVSIAAGGHKLAYIGACMGHSEAYICQLRSGERPLPKDPAKRERFIAAFCAATGSNLLRQYRDLCDALDECSERREVARLAGLLRAAA